jgi:hypothetical protein
MRNKYLQAATGVRCVADTLDRPLKPIPEATASGAVATL